jgi:1,4-alpha-glucan branching enzyme
MLSKNYTSTGRSCRVTFTLPAGLEAGTACLCGEFNEWSATSHPLKRRKEGGFAIEVSLKPGASYRFRYLLDGVRWENDDAADGYAPNPYGDDDSVVSV